MSILKFLGNGSCFNTAAGNTSAYCIVYTEANTGRVLIEGEKAWYDTPCNSRKLILFDCGETVFERLIEREILNDVDEVDIFITHLHSDHAGSLPSLIFYLNYVKKVKPTIFTAVSNIKDYLNICGVNDDLYTIADGKNVFVAISQEHSKSIEAYGYIVNIAGKFIYYSGDSKTVPDVILQYLINPYANALENFMPTTISEFYQDVTCYENDAHQNISTLATIIPKNVRNKIFCMHFDDELTRAKALMLGFKTAIIA